MNLKDVLEQTGLTPNEAKIYLIILERSICAPGELAKAAELHRSSIYDTLKSLQQKGLITDIIIDKKHLFKPINPEKFIDVQREKIDILRDHMPQLMNLHFKSKVDHDIKVYTGKSGIKAIFEDIIRSGKDLDVFGSESDYETILPYTLEKFKRHFEKNNIRIRHIVRKGLSPNRPKTCEVRYINSKERLPVATNIYGNKVAIIIWSDEPNGVIIKNKLNADTYRAFFNFMWGSAERLNS
jgi:HTH-type transcriptional regulator, sugar sensing transcriptional regulator